MKNGLVIQGLLLVLVLSITGQDAHAAGTVSCTQKRLWQRSIVETTIDRWFAEKARAEDLLDLLQSEQGIAACALGKRELPNLHTPTLPRDLALDELGAILLANELAWSRLLPPSEEGVAGRTFRVVPGSVGDGVRP